MRKGGYDPGQLVQAFARHRIQARADALEEAANKATSFLVGDPSAGVPLRNPMAHEIATAIRSLANNHDERGR